MNEKAEKQDTNALPPAVMDYATLSVIARVARESLVGARLRKVIGLAAGELVFLFDRHGVSDAEGGFDAWLFSADPVLFRVHPWLDQLPQESQPSHIVEVASHHLAGAGVTGVDLAPFERVLTLFFSRRDYSGDESQYQLIVELMGKHSNVILVDRKNIILASWKPVHSYQSRAREIRAGKAYVPPPAQERITAKRFSPDDWRKFLEAGGDFDPIGDHLARTFSGMSHGWARAVCDRAGIAPDRTAATLSEVEVDRLLGAFGETLRLVENGEPLTGESPPNLVERIAREFSDRADTATLEKARNELRRILNRRRKRLRTLEKALGEDLDQAEKADDYRKRADLLLANIHAVSPGMDAIEVEDWESGDRVRLSIDPNLPPQVQAEIWYGRYRKLKRRQTVASERRRAVAAAEEELDTLERSLAQASGIEDLNRVREQCVVLGLIEPSTPSKVRPRGRKRGPLGKQRRVGERVEIGAHRYRSNDGFLIVAGKGDRSNDALRRMSRPDDIWLHVRDIPGSHVYIITRGRLVPETTLREAAMVAVWHSKAREGANVPVDYTRAKYVDPIPGDRLGKVRFRRERTLRITPDIKRLDMMRLLAGGGDTPGNE